MSGVKHEWCLNTGSMEARELGESKGCGHVSDEASAGQVWHFAGCEPAPPLVALWEGLSAATERPRTPRRTYLNVFIRAGEWCVCV